MPERRSLRLTEREAVELFKARFASEAGAARVGIGDDAAVLESDAVPWVCSVDACVEGVHFEHAYLSLADIGYRAFQAALSDLAAMGARPVAALSSLILPGGFARDELEALSQGQAESARDGACPIVGGNVSRGRELSITTTVLGRAERPLLRSGARPGQEVWLVGVLGQAALGLASLRGSSSASVRGSSSASVRGSSSASVRGGPRNTDAPTTAALEACVRSWRRPRALVREGLALVGAASAAIDVSDGLAADAARLAEASAVRLVIERERLRAALKADLILGSRALCRSALVFALRGGEDYALLATGARKLRPQGAVPIGYVAQGRGAWLSGPGGRTALRAGYDHFARPA